MSLPYRNSQISNLLEQFEACRLRVSLPLLDTLLAVLGVVDLALFADGALVVAPLLFTLGLVLVGLLPLAALGALILVLDLILSALDLLLLALGLILVRLLSIGALSALVLGLDLVLGAVIVLLLFALGLVLVGFLAARALGALLAILGVLDLVLGAGARSVAFFAFRLVLVGLLAIRALDTLLLVLVLRVGDLALGTSAALFAFGLILVGFLAVGAFDALLLVFVFGVCDLVLGAGVGRVASRVNIKVCFPNLSSSYPTRRQLSIVRHKVRVIDKLCRSMETGWGVVSSDLGGRDEIGDE
ncbi:hypothetical protein PG989_000450 [Apiospora arundinis]